MPMTADVIKPTTAGLRPINAFCTITESSNFWSAVAINVIDRNAGAVTESVAAIPPTKP